MMLGLAGGVVLLAWLFLGGSARASLVFEAEEVTEIDGTWELRSDPRASGGSVLFVGEGTGRSNPPVHLARGANEIALAVRQHRSWWQMRVRIRKPDGGVGGVR